MSTARADAGRAAPARDLGSPEVWERSLVRSRQRRRLAVIGRRSRRRRGSVSLAVSAAIVAAPVLPQATAAATTDPGTVAPETVGPGSLPSHVVLRLGATGPLVAAVQMRLNQALPSAHLAVDGIYGPLTRAAVWQFQHVHELAMTGAVDVRMWSLLFNAPVLGLTGSGTATGTGTAAAAPASVARATSDSTPRFSSLHTEAARTGVPETSPAAGTSNTERERPGRRAAGGCAGNHRHGR